MVVLAPAPHAEHEQVLPRLDDPTDDDIALFTALHGNQEDTDAYFGIFAQTVGADEFFAPENVERIISQAGSAAATA